MTVLELLEAYENDFDVYDDYDERCACAYCGTKLTEEGRKHYKRALSLNVYVFDGRSAVIECYTAKEAQALADLIYGAAGYISEEEYNKYFYDD